MKPDFHLCHLCGTTFFPVFTRQREEGDGWEATSPGMARAGCWTAAPSIAGTSETCLCKTWHRHGFWSQSISKEAGRSLVFSLPDAPSFRKEFSCLSKKAFQWCTDSYTAKRGHRAVASAPRPPICGKQRDNVEKVATGWGTLRKYKNWGAPGSHSS